MKTDLDEKLGPLYLGPEEPWVHKSLGPIGSMSPTLCGSSSGRPVAPVGTYGTRYCPDCLRIARAMGYRA